MMTRLRDVDGNDISPPYAREIILAPDDKNFIESCLSAATGAEMRPVLSLRPSCHHLRFYHAH